MLRSTGLRAIALIGVIGLVLAGQPAADAHRTGHGHGHGNGSGPTVIADGLDNPRGLSFGPDGALYVAEAGSGGSGPCFAGPEGPACFGKSGAVTRISKWGQQRVVKRLPSFGGEGTGDGAIGPSDVAFKSGKMYVTEGLGLDLDFSKTIPELDDMGQLLSVKAKKHKKHKRHHHLSRVRTVADLADFEDEFNPTGDEENVNPNSVLATRHGTVVADAGANDLLLVTKRGKVKVLATFPNAPGGPDAVPTSVTRGPDGKLYVGQLTGFPFTVGSANVYRINHGVPEVFASGFTNIIDIAFDRHGTLYVLEIFQNGLLSGDPTGALIRVEDDGTQTVVMSTGLITPGGLALRGHHAYVSNCGTCADGGEVLRIPLD